MPEHEIVVPRLPAAFDGLRVALIADTHHGAWAPASYLRGVVRLANAAKPDIVALGGDYLTHRFKRSRRRDVFTAADLARVRASIQVLAGLRAPLGVHAVLGNHDHWESPLGARSEIAALGYNDLTNAGVWFERGDARLRFCGVDDLWEGRPNPVEALGDARPNDCVVLLAHNPEFAETLIDPRLSLILSGHTHGGQVVLPGVGALILPLQISRRYASGLVHGPICPVFVTRGVGTIFPPVRFNCPAEVPILVLRRAV